MMEPSAPANAIAAAIHQSCPVIISQGNAVVVLEDGPQTFPAMLRDIAAAEHTINFENFKIQSDVTGWEFANALAERARAGVVVNVLYDAIGSASSSVDFWAFLVGAGVNVRPFHPLRGRTSVLVRDHRKVMLIDGRIGYLGGLCIGDQWVSTQQSRRVWRDTHCRIEGPAVRTLQETFCELWRESGGGGCEPGDLAYFPELPKAGPLEVMIINCGRQRSIKIAYEQLIASARWRLRIMNAYFCPPAEIVDLLKKAAQRGVLVQIIVPGRSDIDIMVTAARSIYTDLLKAGVEIYEYQPTVLHAKTALVDGCWATIGSCNLDSLSLAVNYETNIGICGTDFVSALEARFEADLRDSARIDLGVWRRRPLRQKIREMIIGTVGGQLL